MSESACKDCSDHRGHLCVLASTGQIDRIIELSANPKFICFNCGRVAHDAGNLCNPMPLPTAGKSTTSPAQGRT